MAPNAYDPQGYYRLAQLMSRDQDFAIFRKFDAANALRLLYLQAEVIDAEADLHYQCRLDDQSNGEEKDYSTQFLKLREAGAASDQYELLNVLMIKLKEYTDEALLQVSQLSILPDANKRQLNVLNDWLGDKLGGNNFLRKIEDRTWQLEDGVTFTTLSAVRDEGDALSRFISWFVQTWLMRLCCARTGIIIDEPTQLRSYSNSKIDTFCTVLVTILSSTFPVVSILVLYLVKNTFARIGITIGFTAAFAAVLAMFSRARRVEIFAATATFAAVEVVFIGSALNS